MLKSILQKLLIVILIGLVASIGSKLGIAAYERYQVQLEINKAQAQVADLQKSNDELKRLISQLGNKEFLTLKIKEELNVKEAGEKIAIIKKNPQPEVTQPALIPEKNSGYLRQWWDLFFKPE